MNISHHSRTRNTGTVPYYNGNSMFIRSESGVYLEAFFDCLLRSLSKRKTKPYELSANSLRGLALSRIGQNLSSPVHRIQSSRSSSTHSVKQIFLHP